MNNIPPSAPDDFQKNMFPPETLRQIREGKNEIQTSGGIATVQMSLWLLNSFGDLMPKQIHVTQALDKLIPDFNYSKPVPWSELAAEEINVGRTRESAPRSGYFFLALLEAPELYGLMRTNHFYGEGTEFALVAATDQEGKEFRYFPFDCLEPGFQDELLAHFPKTEVQ